MTTKLAIALTLGAFLAAGCTMASEEPVETQDIEIPGPWVFEPKVAVVQAGVPVTWTNNGGAGHTVTIPELGIDETVKPGETFTFTFIEAGTFEYECILHPPDMVGRIIVVGVGTSTSNASSTNTTTSPHMVN